MVEATTGNSAKSGYLRRGVLGAYHMYAYVYDLCIHGYTCIHICIHISI